MTSDEDFMRVALDRARDALNNGEVPIGAVVVVEGSVVAEAGNEREARNDPTAHAEILALRAAAEALSSRHLDQASIYVTLEPCAMCAGALVLARVRRLIYGCPDPRAGAAYSLYNISQDPRLNHEVEITTGVLAEESSDLLRGFFASRRGS